MSVDYLTEPGRGVPRRRAGAATGRAVRAGLLEPLLPDEGDPRLARDRRRRARRSCASYFRASGSFGEPVAAGAPSGGDPVFGVAPCAGERLSVAPTTEYAHCAQRCSHMALTRFGGPLSRSLPETRTFTVEGPAHSAAARAVPPPGAGGRGRRRARRRRARHRARRACCTRPGSGRSSTCRPRTSARSCSAALRHRHPLPVEDGGTKYKSPSGTVNRVKLPKSTVVPMPNAQVPPDLYVPQTGKVVPNLPTVSGSGRGGAETFQDRAARCAHQAGVFGQGADRGSYMGACVNQ